MVCWAGGSREPSLLRHHRIDGAAWGPLPQTAPAARCPRCWCFTAGPGEALQRDGAGEALPPPNLGNFGSSCLPKPGPGSG